MTAPRLVDVEELIPTAPRPVQYGEMPPGVDVKSDDESEVFQVNAAEWAGLNPPYRTIVADPPWRYDVVNPPNPGLAGHIGRPVKATPLPYSTMPIDEIRDLRVNELADDDARLYLWTTNRYLRDAWSVVEAWGFRPLGRVFVWCKQPMGTANVTTEFFLVGVKGRPPRLPWHNSTWFDWKRQHHSHSTKPAPFFDLVEKWSPGPYVELFARAPRLGWDSWGYGYENSSTRTNELDVDC